MCDTKKIELSSLGVTKCRREALETLGRLTLSGFTWNQDWVMSPCLDGIDTLLYQSGRMGLLRVSQRGLEWLLNSFKRLQHFPCDTFGHGDG